jgi:endonuclease/exonuclease/phosphatase family metal-dependent hydrolase
MQATLSSTVRLGLAAALALLSIPALAKKGGTPLTFTEVNLNWFGLDGSPDNNAGDETRVDSIRQYLQDQGLMADVMAFEEIVDLDMLKSGILDDAYSCASYDRDDPKHQHVVICVRQGLTFAPADGADGYALESVDVNGHLRPAVHGIVEDAAGRRLAHVFAVHLKAMPDKSDVRLQQVQALGDYLANRRAGGEPVVILGDWNTYASDPENFQKVLGPNGLRLAEEPEPYTWASVTENFPPAKFDRVWMSDALAGKVASLHVIGPCSSGDKTEIGDYNTDVSDHCPVSLKLDL